MPIERHPIIGVMGSHERAWSDYSTPVGRMIAEFDYHLLTGAGGGVMTAVAQAFMSVENREGVSIGIIPTTDYKGGYVAREQYPNPYIDIPILTPLDKKVQGDASPFSRNYVNVMTSSAIILLPGEHGTQNEASLALQYGKQAILFGPEEEFSRFPEQLTRTEDLEEVHEFLASVRTKLRAGISDD